ncbi:MAG TPA: ornithine--acyl-ACP N-acyltransferase OlsB [Alphaproteobacteria bacterium]|nr:ornithine--acyl-ACP N-acyltransferase OlsB [Alphaproteobacteria bacterium]
MGFVADAGGALLATYGTLEVRLAQEEAEVLQAQRLRYEVFYKEMSATPSAAMAEAERDFDHFDPICDHLLVIDTAAGHAVVGTYRLLRDTVAAAHGGFYTAGEYDIAPMLNGRPPGFRFLELGRSCVLAKYRTGTTMQLLWRGIVVYLARYNIDLMFGCASLPGTDPKALALPLSFLHHFHLAPEGERVRALPDRYVSMDLMPKDAMQPMEGMKALPPLIKGYVRTGAYVGDGAVVDYEFGTTDVFIYFPVSRVNPRWLAHYRKKLG